MIQIKPKTRSLKVLNTIEDVIPYLEKFSKNWKELTPSVEARINTLLENDTFYPGMSHFSKALRKDVLEMRSGTFSRQQYIDIFGWSEEEADELLSEKGKLFKETTGGFTPGQKEFWVKHHGMSEEDAVKAVSTAQRKLSVRKKKTTKNQPTSLQFYLSRGASEEEALKAQSEVQKKRRNTCLEYWLTRGYSEEDAKQEISKLQKLRSKLSVEYWLHRGHSLEEAQKKSYQFQNHQLPGKFSKCSQRFFNDVVDKLTHHGFNREDFVFGIKEHCIYISDNKRIYCDFFHEASNKIVEFDGIYWHKNNLDKDAYRDARLRELGYSILRIDETYNKIKWSENVNTAVKFILGELA